MMRLGKSEGGTATRWENVLLLDGQLRPILRFLISVAMIVLAYVGIGIFLGIVFSISGRQPQLMVSLFWSGLLMLIALLGIFRILTGVFEGKPLGSAGLAFCGRWKMELGIGVGLGTSMIFLVAGLERSLGLANFAWNAGQPGRVLVTGFFFCLLMFIAAVNEEMAFRGYPFQRLVDSMGPVGAVAVSSALFGLAHLGNPFHTWFSTFNAMLVGVPLAVAYLRTRALWMPIGIHFAWNFVEGYGLGLPVSGLVLPATAVKPAVHDFAWLTGGTYGPEGGLLTSAAIAAATLYLSLSRSIYTSEEMKALVFGPSHVQDGRVEARSHNSPAPACPASDGTGACRGPRRPV